MHATRFFAIPGLVALVLCASPSLASTPPSGWSAGGDAYDVGTSHTELFRGKPTAYIRAIKPPAGGDFGTLSQATDAVAYRGKRVRFSAWLATTAATSAGLWLRIDGPGGKPVALDNMEDRPVKGTLGWQRYADVLDVPSNATRVIYGVLLEGQGKVSVASATFEVVDKTVPTTHDWHHVEEAPTGLDFEAPSPTPHPDR